MNGFLFYIKFRASSFEHVIYGIIPYVIAVTITLLGLSCKQNLLKVLTILGRLNYSIYMGHILFMYLDVFSTKQPFQFDSYSILTKTCTVLFIGVIFGYIIHILFEAPFRQLYRRFFP